MKEESKSTNENLWESPASDPITDCKRALMSMGSSEREAEIWIEGLMGKRKLDSDLCTDLMFGKMRRSLENQKSGGTEMNAQNMRNAELPENKSTNNYSTELSNCLVSWAKDPAGGECALEIKPAEVVHSVRFRTISETIWLMSKKPVKLRIVWGKEDQRFTTGKAWNRFDLGRAPRGSEWIVTLIFGDDSEFYLYPFALVESVAVDAS